MRRSTTSAVTDRRRDAHARGRTKLAAFLIAELIFALLLVGRGDAPSHPPVAAPSAGVSPATPPAQARSTVLRDGRTVRLLGLGAETAPLLTRIAAEMDGAASSVTAFWGDDWPREITVAAAATDEQFAAVGGGDVDTAATTTAERMMFAPGAASMSDDALRIVVRHELFHYAARAATAADAPRWLTEGVADYVARPAAPAARVAATLPTDAELSGPDRAAAYDRAWSWAGFVAESYGRPALRRLYLEACGPGHPDVAAAVRDTLGADLGDVLMRWRHWTAQ